jgi:hypothetical protein
VFETYRDDVTIVKNRLVDRIDPPRMFPLVGPAQLHHCHWECVVYFTETVQANYPFPAKVQKKRVQVVYIDKDVLHLSAGQEPAVPLPQLMPPTPTAPVHCDGIMLTASSVVPPRPSGTWYREMPGMVSAVAFKGDEMKVTLTANNVGTVVTLTVTADCSVTKDGTVHGVITGVDVNVTSGKDPSDMELASLALGLQAFVDQPFAFRCRTTDGSVMVSSIRISCVKDSNDEFAAVIKTLFAGLYKPAANGVLPAPNPEKVTGLINEYSSDPNVRVQQLLTEPQPVCNPPAPLCPGGMTPPSPRYLQQVPQYVTPDVCLPLPRDSHTQLDLDCRVHPIGVDFNGWTPNGPSRPATPPAIQPLISGCVYVPYPGVPQLTCPGPVCPTNYTATMLPPKYQGPVLPTNNYVAPPTLTPQPLPQASLGQGSAPGASRMVTIRDVVELAQCGASDDVVINQMRNTNSKYTLSVADIKYLKMCGVSDKIIIEMQGCIQPSAGCQLPAVPQAVYPPAISYSSPR